MFEYHICFMSEAGSLADSGLKENIPNSSPPCQQCGGDSEAISGCAATGVNILTSATLGLPTFCLCLC